MQIRVAFWWTVREGPSRVPGGERALCIDSESCLSKGSAMLTCPTIPSSKNVHGRTYPHQRPSAQFSPPPPNKPPQLTPLVQSTTPPTTKKSLGRTSSLKLPTALNPTTALHPNFFSAATFARKGISCGAWVWCGPWRARKATIVGLGGIGGLLVEVGV